MKSSAAKRGAIFAICAIAICAPAGPSINTNKPTEKAPKIKTTFAPNAELTPQEIKDVLALAKQCGISQPGEVSTFQWLSGGGYGVEVKSVELVKGRDITFDKIVMGKTGWTDIGLDDHVKRVGKFWATPSQKYPTHLRMYDFRGEQIRIYIDKGITTELADKIIPLIAAKKVRFPDETGVFFFRDMKEMINSKPSGLTKESDGKLLLHFERDLDVLQFRFENNEIVLEDVIHINI